MIERIKEKQVYNSINHIFEIGNYRLEYYKLFKTHFDKIVKKEVLQKLFPYKKNILYCPTWKDIENSSSFDNYFHLILKEAATKYNLIVKLHPNLVETHFSQIEILKAKYEKKGLLFLDNFPLIYPLLNITDIYLGDFSSIGYDFLYFQRHMFFLQPQNKILQSDIFDCGYLIDNTNVFETIENKLKGKIKKNKIQMLYNKTFKQKINLKQIKNKLY